MPKWQDILCKEAIFIYSKNYGKIPDKPDEAPPVQEREFASPPPDYGGSLFDMPKPCEEACEPPKCPPPPPEAKCCENILREKPPAPKCENPCDENKSAGLLGKISAEDILLFGAALFLLFSKDNDNLIILALLVLVIMI